MKDCFLLTMVVLVGCDEKTPATKEEMVAQEQKKEAARLNRLDGQTVYVAPQSPKRESAKSPDPSFDGLPPELRPTRFEPSEWPTTIHAHLRKDCPALLEELKKPRSTLSTLQVRNGRFVDSKGFFSDESLCTTCIE